MKKVLTKMTNKYQFSFFFEDDKDIFMMKEINFNKQTTFSNKI